MAAWLPAWRAVRRSHERASTRPPRNTQGAAAGAPVNLFVYVKDAQNRQMKEGGEDVVVRLHPQPAGRAQPIQASILDNDNGVYTATYTAPAKGNYMVSVEVNGRPISGSPFPVFFSTPVDPEAAAAAAQQQQQEEAAAAAAAAGLPPGAQQVPGEAAAAAALAAAVPAADEPLRTLYVANISPIVPLDRLRELFGIFGVVQELQVRL